MRIRKCPRLKRADFSINQYRQIKEKSFWERRMREEESLPVVFIVIIIELTALQISVTGITVGMHI
jgi:hypothetical protein